jgi:hypothetical protein
MMSELNWKETMSVPDQMPYLLLEDGRHIQINSLQTSRRSGSRELTRNALEHQFGALLTSELAS